MTTGAYVSLHHTQPRLHADGGPKTVLLRSLHLSRFVPEVLVLDLRRLLPPPSGVVTAKNNRFQAMAINVEMWSADGPLSAQTVSKRQSAYNSAGPERSRRA